MKEKTQAERIAMSDLRCVNHTPEDLEVRKQATPHCCPAKG